MSYLLDENVDVALRAGLLRHDPNLIAWKIGEFGAPPFGTPDTELLEWCERNSAFLITNNRRSMPVHLAEHLAAGLHIPGIFILNPKMSLGETVDEILLIMGASHLEEYRDRLIHLPVSYSMRDS